MSISFLWLAAATGALSLLTPCVFPMIPVTMAYFNQRSGAGHKHVLRDAFLFAAGIVVTFTAIGLGLSILVGATGVARFAANPWVNIAIGMAFIAFALSLFGLYDLPLPFSNRLLNRVHASSRANSGKAAGSLLMGLGFTLASFTCTAPFIGPLLVSAARGEWQTPLAGMLVFSIIFALPFFLLALMPRWTGALPRAGFWLRDVKIVVGLFEIAAALKFFSNADLVWGTGIISRSGMLSAWIIIALAAMAWLAYSALKRTPPRRAPLRWIPAAASAGLVLWLATGLRGQSLGEVEAFLPPDAFILEAMNKGPVRLDWIVNDHSKALNAAATSEKLVFVDFTGYTCTNCRWMESNMFSRPEVRASLSRYVLSRLYTDGEGDVYERQQKFQEDKFGTVALPLYAIVDANGRTVRTFSGLTRSSGEFLAFLRNAS